MAKQLFPDGTEVSTMYVRTIRSGPFVFVSGTTSLDPKGRVQGNGAAEQTRITMQKIERGLRQAGATLKDIVRLNIFVTDIRDMTAVTGAIQKGAEAHDHHLDPRGRKPARDTRAGGRDRGHGHRGLTPILSSHHTHSGATGRVDTIDTDQASTDKNCFISVG